MVSLIASATEAAPPADVFDLIAVGRVAMDSEPFATLIRQLRSRTDINVVATPSIVVRENEPGTIKVSKQVPFSGNLFDPAEKSLAPPQDVRAGSALIVDLRSARSADGALLVSVAMHVTGDDAAAGSEQQVRRISASLLIRDGSVAVVGIPGVMGRPALLFYIRPQVLGSTDINR